MQSASTTEPTQVLSNEGTIATKTAVKSKSKSSGETSVKKLSSNKTEKLTKERDPNAPKKPANAFFWFCQEKRSEVQDKLAREGNVGHHDLTKVLSKMWGEIPNSDKKVSQPAMSLHIWEILEGKFWKVVVSEIIQLVCLYSKFYFCNGFPKFTFQKFPTLQL